MWAYGLLLHIAVGKVLYLQCCAVRANEPLPPFDEPGFVTHKASCKWCSEVNTHVDGLEFVYLPILMTSLFTSSSRILRACTLMS